MLQEPGAVGVQAAQGVEAAHLAQQGTGVGVGAGLDAGHEGFEDPALQVRPGDEEHVLTEPVEGLEVVAIGMRGDAHPPGQRLQRVPLPLGEHQGLPAAVDHRQLVGLTAGGPGQSFHHGAGRGPLGDGLPHCPRGGLDDAGPVEFAPQLPVVGQQRLGHQLQQNGVVALEGGEDVDIGAQRGQPVLGHVPGPAAGLAAALQGLVGEAGRHRFQPGGEGLQLALVAFGGFVQSLHLHQQLVEVVLGEAERVGAGQQRQQPALVGQVVEQQDAVAAAGGRELTALQRVPGGDREAAAGRDPGAGRDADPATDQRPEHGEEAPARRFDHRGVAALLVHAAVAVEQHAARHPHVVEPDRPVVDAHQAALVALIGGGDAGQVASGLVANRHQDGVHPMPDVVDHQLAEDDRHRAVLPGVADVGLGGRRGRRIHLELVGRRIVGEGRLDARHIRAVAQFGHGEAAEQFQPGERRQEGVVVPRGAQVGDRAAEEPELHPRLDQHRQVAVGEQLEGHHRVLGRAMIIGRDRDAGRAEARVRQLAEPGEHPFTGLVHGLGGIAQQVLGREVRSSAGARFGERAVEGGAQRLAQGRGVGGQQHLSSPVVG